MQNKNKKLIFSATVIIALVVVMVFLVNSNFSSSLSSPLANVEIKPAVQVDAVNMTDHLQNNVTRERFSDRWSFVFFGFTHCPDVCPATLSQLTHFNKVIRNKMSLATQTQFIFVSVDPERDSIAHLAEYIKYFDASFIAMTGTKQAIKKLEQQLGAFHRIKNKGSNEFYTVQHSADIFLINPSGKLIAKFTPPIDPSLMLTQFSLFVERYKNAKNTLG